MYGSSWSATGSYVISDASRFILHALPSADIYAQLRGGGQSKIIVVVESASAGNSAVDRNGYQSQSTGVRSNLICTEITYWDTALGKAITLNPSTQTGPTDYVW